jgi:HEAT repeat protein
MLSSDMNLEQEKTADTRSSMKRRWFWILMVGFITVVLGWVYQATGPRYKGRTANHWFALYDSRDQSDREITVAAFRAMGSKAVPMLVAKLEASPSDFDSAIDSVLKSFRSGYPNYSQRLNWNRATACHLLREIGEPARAAIPALEKASTNGLWYVATGARAALIKMRKEPIAPYIELLKDKSEPIKWYPNAMLLGYCGTNAALAVPLLLESLQDSNHLIQAHALVALGMIKSDSQDCVPAIIPFLTSSDVALRQKAYSAILEFKDHAQSASDEIILGLNDSDPWTRGLALSGVEEILSPEDQRRALPGVEALVGSSDSFIRDSASKLSKKIRTAPSQ